MFRESTFSALELAKPSQRILGKKMQVWMDILSAQKILPPSKNKLIQFLSTNYMMQECDAEHLVHHFLLLHDTETGSIYPEGYEITSTRTYNVGMHVLESFFTEPDVRKSAFLVNMQLIKHNPGKNIRFQLEQEEVLVANFTGKSAEKCQVTLQHTKLADAARAEVMRTYWKERLQMLSELISGNDKR